MALLLYQLGASGQVNSFLSPAAAAAAAKLLQSCPTPSDPTDCSPPGSIIHGICQARVLEWGAIAFSNCCNNLVKFKCYFVTFNTYFLA